MTFKCHKVEKNNSNGSRAPLMYPVNGIGFNVR